MVQPRRYYSQLKAPARFNPRDFIDVLQSIDQDRVESIGRSVADYLEMNLAETIQNRQTLQDYRLNPYVLLTAAHSLQLVDMDTMAAFLFNTKAYMGLETSFGKALETTVLPHYPFTEATNWATPEEKIAEFEELEGLEREERARVRVQSVWREIDASSIIGRHRFLVTVKSGPQTINDTQVEAMRSAIATNYRQWFQSSRQRYGINQLDIVIGLTYGTPKTTNNKENQLLLKLLDSGFVLDEGGPHPGGIIDGATGRIRVYRVIGTGFWSLIGHPTDPPLGRHVFLEVLFGISRALSRLDDTSLEELTNTKIDELSAALTQMRFPGQSLPEWARASISPAELTWVTTAMTAFFDP